MENEKKPSNPFAFSSTANENSDTEYEQGMTLRDYFANDADVKSELDGISTGKAIKLMGVDKIPTGDENFIFWFELEAKLKYMKADSMLKQREL